MASETKLIVIDTQTFFELEIPADMDPEEFLNSEECRHRCVDNIMDFTTDIEIDRVLTVFDPIRQKWTEE